MFGPLLECLHIMVSVSAFVSIFEMVHEPQHQFARMTSAQPSSNLNLSQYYFFEYNPPLGLTNLTDYSNMEREAVDL